MILDPKPLNIVWGNEKCLIWQYLDGTWTWQTIEMDFNLKKLISGYYIDEIYLVTDINELNYLITGIPVLWRRKDDEFRICTCGGKKTNTTHSHWCDAYTAY